MSASRPWTEEEIDRAVRMEAEGLSITRISNTLRRTSPAVAQHILFAKIRNDPVKYGEVIRGHEVIVAEHWAKYRPFEIAHILNSRVEYVLWLADRLGFERFTHGAGLANAIHKRRPGVIYSPEDIGWAIENFFTSKEARLMACMLDESEKQAGRRTLGASNPVARKLRALWGMLLTIRQGNAISSAKDDGRFGYGIPDLMKEGGNVSGK